jgi:hypothetical protein
MPINMPNPFVPSTYSSGFSEGGGEVGDGGGFLGAIGKFGTLMSNPLIQQYLSGTGKGLTQGGFQGGIGAASDITQQNNTNQNYLKVLKKMLSGDLADGASIKHTKAGTQITIPKVTPEGEPGPNEGDNALGGIFPEAGAVGTPSNNNPMAQLSMTDLSGLSPDMITQALQFRMSKEALDQRKYESSLDEVHKGALDKYHQANIANMEADNKLAREKMNEVEPLDKPFAIQYGGKDISVRQWNALPKDEQDYAIHVADKGSKAISREEFKLLEPTDREKFLTKAMKNPKLMKAAKELEAAGSTTINVGERVMEEGRAKDKLTILDPSFASDTKAEVMKSLGPLDDTKNILAKVINAMDDKIVRVYGEGNVTISKDGWTVVDKDRNKTHFIPRPIQ